MKIYITGKAAISPQNTLSPNWNESHSIPTEGVFACIEPAYSEYLDPKATRRMSRVMKMGLTSALICLKNANIDSPDAILTATGLGCLDDTATFLSKLSQEDGQLLSPTAFIQSTHNTVGGAIALQLKCNCYNNTFSQRGFSFESALTEAMLMLNDGQAQSILIGAIDETIEPLNQILKQLRNLPHSNSHMVAIGEGATFLMLTNRPTPDTVELAYFKTYYKPLAEQLPAAIEEMVNEFGQPDLVLLGKNGNVSNDRHYQWITSILKDTPMVDYKQLCGEYPTAPAFAHWMACSLLTKGETNLNPPKKILVCNHFEGRNHTFTLFSK